MNIVVIASAEQKEELLPGITNDGQIINWTNELTTITTAGAVIDLLFDNDPEEHFGILKKISSTIIAINDVSGREEKLPGNFVRINGWPTFLSKEIIEAYCENETVKTEAEDLFSLFGKKIEWLPATPGFIAPRIVSMIINEAYFANSEDVSSRDEIDIAMKSGTNYPYGPFEWAAKIGLKKIYTLLKKLEGIDNAYKPCELLVKEANW